MPIQEINPFLKFKSYSGILNDVKTNTTPIQNKTKLNPNIIKGLAALTILGVGIAAVVKVKNLNPLNKTIKTLTENAQEDAENIFENSKKLLNEVIEIYNKDSSTVPNYAWLKITTEDNKIIRKITYKNDYASIMEEFSKEGNLVRKTFFEKDTTIIQQNGKKLSDNTFDFDEIMAFTKGKLFSYEKGHSTLEGNKEKWDKYILFDKGKPHFYAKELEMINNKVKKYFEGITFSEGKPVFYIQEYKELEDGTVQFAKRLRLFKGVWR